MESIKLESWGVSQNYITLKISLGFAPSLEGIPKEIYCLNITKYVKMGYTQKL